MTKHLYIDFYSARKRVSIIPRKGLFAGQRVFTNKNGEGIFTKNEHGDHIQHTGTCQTPTFRSAAHLSRWLREHWGDYKESES